MFGLSSLFWPEPYNVNGLKIEFKKSPTKADRILLNIEIDYGQFEITAEKAANVTKGLINVLRLGLNRALERFS